MAEFLSDPGNEELKRIYNDYHVTIVCDKINLTKAQRAAFKGYKNENRLTHITWSIFLLRTRKMHEAFLNEAERQKKLATEE